MNDRPKVKVKARSDEIAAVCARPGCRSATFRTDLGVGPVFWFGGVGPTMLQFGQSDSGPRIETGSVTCTSCGMEHDILADVYEPPRRPMMGGNG